MTLTGVVFGPAITGFDDRGIHRRTTVAGFIKDIFDARGVNVDDLATSLEGVMCHALLYQRNNPRRLPGVVDPGMLSKEGYRAGTVNRTQVTRVPYYHYTIPANKGRAILQTHFKCGGHSASLTHPCRTSPVAARETCPFQKAILSHTDESGVWSPRQMKRQVGEPPE